MKLKNYKWKMAFSLTLYVLLPIFVFLDGIIMVVSAFEDDNFGETAWIVNVTFAVMLVLCFFVFLLLGDILFKTHTFRQDQDNFYQNKKKLAKDDVFFIHLGRFFSMFSLTFFPVRDGKFRSKKLLYYFYSVEELLEFITKNHILPYLSENVREGIREQQLLKGWKLTEIGLPTIERYSCPCCGHKTFTEKPGGTYFICPVCFWEDDAEGLEHPNETFSCNKVSLSEAKENYKKFGACREEEKEYVRMPEEFE